MEEHTPRIEHHLCVVLCRAHYIIQYTNLYFLITLHIYTKYNLNNIIHLLYKIIVSQCTTKYLYVYVIFYDNI